MKQKITNEEKKILEFLQKDDSNYYNIKNLSKKLSMSYPTILKRIDILCRLDYIKIINVVNNKVCILKNKKEK